MDPDLRKLLSDAHAAGASDDDLHSLIDKWNADHVSGGIKDISPQLQKQADAQGVGAGSTFSGLQGVKRGFQSDVAGLPARAVALTQGIPGVRALAEGINSKMMGVPYEQVDKSVTQGLKSVPPAQRAALGMVGGLATAPFLPANPALAGGILGAASEAGNSVPTPIAQRVQNTIGGAVAGAGAGYAGGKLLNAGTKLSGAVAANLQSRFAPNADEAIVGSTKVVNPAVSSAQYQNAAQSAAPRQPTSAIASVLQDPDVQQLANKVSALPQYRGVSQDDPEFLMALDQRLTDTRRQLEKGLLPAEPSNPNTKRELIDAAHAVQQKLRTAMATPDQNVPAYMPEYLDAVGHHAEGKGLESAFGLGYDAQLANSGGGPLSRKQVGTVSPAAVANEAGTMTPDETGQLRTGVLSALKEQPGRRKMILPSLEAYRAAGLINASQGRPVRPEMSALLRNLLFGAASSPFTTP